MKNCITLLTLLIAMSTAAQKTYLRIFKDSTKAEMIAYPPGTAFELKNRHGYIQLKNSETARKFYIKEPFTIHVYPSYKQKPDKISLATGALVELALTQNYANTAEINKKSRPDKQEVIARKTLTDSRKRKAEKNLVFKLSNGWVFNYVDGHYFATFKDKYLVIRGKYIMATQDGVLKLSYDPTSGKVWWVYEKNK